MTSQKDLKRVVRTRMQKTGESYTAARVHVLARKRSAAARTAAAELIAEPAPAAPETTATTAAARANATTSKPATAKTATTTKAPAKKRATKTRQPAVDYAALAGMSDAKIAEKTGCTWEKWVGHLDHWGAAEKTHREIADHVHTKFGVPDWWTQAVTVGYERIKGLRAIGQRRSGAYETSKSKTIAVPLAELYAAWADDKARRRWLPGVALVVRKTTPEKYMRITWDDQTSVVVGFFAKGAGKSLVAVQHSKLADKARADELKRFWGERLDALAEQLAGSR
jgi:uncharacterized protein YndB with AHSA1/START domain